MLELISTESMDASMAKNNRLLAAEDYIKIFVDEANRKLDKTREKAKKLYGLLGLMRFPVPETKNK